MCESTLRRGKKAIWHERGVQRLDLGRSRKLTSDDRRGRARSQGWSKGSRGGGRRLTDKAVWRERDVQSGIWGALEGSLLTTGMGGNTPRAVQEVPTLENGDLAREGVQK